MRVLRLALGYDSQKEFGLAIGYTEYKAISNYERGAKEPEGVAMAAAAGLTRHRGAVLRWLREGGERPVILPILLPGERTVAEHIEDAVQLLNAVRDYLVRVQVPAVSATAPDVNPETDHEIALPVDPPLKDDNLLVPPNEPPPENGGEQKGDGGSDDGPGDTGTDGKDGG